MGNINVTIRMDEKTKSQAEELYSDLGLNLTTAINAFVNQSLRENRIPFEITRANDPGRKLGLGYKVDAHDEENPVDKLRERLLGSDRHLSLEMVKEALKKIEEQEAAGVDFDEQKAKKEAVKEWRQIIWEGFSYHALLLQRIGALLVLEEELEVERGAWLNQCDRRRAEEFHQAAIGARAAASRLIPLAEEHLGNIIIVLKTLQKYSSDMQKEVLGFALTGCDLDKLADTDACDLDVKIMIDRFFGENTEVHIAAYKSFATFLTEFFNIPDDPIIPDVETDREIVFSRR